MTMLFVTAKRKTAVELLEESKSFYVKSGRVLDTKQELPHSERLHVRMPMLNPSVRLREPPQLPVNLFIRNDRQQRHHLLIPADDADSNCSASRRRESWNTTPPV